MQHSVLQNAETLSRAINIDMQDIKFISQVYSAVNTMDPQQIISMLKHLNIIKLLILDKSKLSEKTELDTAKQNTGRVGIEQNQRCPYILHAMLLSLTNDPKTYFTNFSNDELQELHKTIKLVQLKKLQKPIINEAILATVRAPHNTPNPSGAEMAPNLQQKIQMLKIVSDCWDDAIQHLNAWFNALECYVDNHKSKKATSTVDKKTINDLSPFQIGQTLRINTNAISQETLRTMQAVLPAGAIIELPTKWGPKLYLKKEFLNQFKDAFLPGYSQRKKSKKTATQYDLVSMKSTIAYANVLSDLLTKVKELSDTEDSIWQQHKKETDSNKRAQLREQLGTLSDNRIRIEGIIQKLQNANKVLKDAQSVYSNIFKIATTALRNNIK